MSTATISTFTTKLKQFSGTGFPAWGAQVKLVPETKDRWVAVSEATSTEAELKTERDAAASAVATPGTLTSPISPATPLNDRLMEQKTAASIILAALSEKLAAEVYLLEFPLVMFRHLRLTYNVKCSASIGAAKREYMGLFLDGDDSMIVHIKTTRHVLDELQEQHVTVSDKEKRQKCMQSLGPTWNGFVGVFKASVTLEATLQRCHAEVIRREQQSGRQSTSGSSSGGKATAAFIAEFKPGKKKPKSKKKRDVSKVKCFNCSQFGHYARNCTNDQDPSATRKEAASMAFSVEGAMANSSREWIVDSSATSHMTGHIENLVDVHMLDEPRPLAVASGETMFATDVGNAPLLRDGHEACALYDVLYVKGLARNLVSVAAASRNDMAFLFKGVSCVIRSENGMTLEASQEPHHMYVVSMTSESVGEAAMMATEALHVKNVAPSSWSSKHTKRTASSRRSGASLERSDGTGLSDLCEWQTNSKTISCEETS